MVMAISLSQLLPRSALAFRGYNTTNLGRTPELLAVPAYQPILTSRLRRVAEVASDQLGRPVDLVRRVAERLPTGFDDYADAVALVYAVELGQLDLLRQVHGLDVAQAQMAYGYSLGEVVALAAAGATPEDEAIRAPLAMADDCAALAEGVTMGVVFSRTLALSEVEAHRLCADITSEGNGTIAVSAVLSPNTLIVLGQNGTLDRFRQAMSLLCPDRVYLRQNDSRWPPLHTPIVRQRSVPDRASVMIQSMRADASAAHPPVFSLVTGRMTASEPSLHELLRLWIDHPQRLWDAVCVTLASNVRSVIHVGPEPNLIPATFKRLKDNVLQQTSGNSVAGLSMRALKQLAGRPWLASIVPQRASLLRAPEVEQIILEDWLLENAPS